MRSVASVPCTIIRSIQITGSVHVTTQELNEIWSSCIELTCDWDANCKDPRAAPYGPEQSSRIGLLWKTTIIPLPMTI
jgi:hypothetical protein